MEKGFFPDEQFEFRSLASKKTETPHPLPPPTASDSPTPNLVPKSVTTRADIPKDLLRSNVIDSLVVQNEDLTARLSVTLKKMALLEDRLSSQLAKENEHNQTIERFQDQIFLYEEKIRLIEDLKKSESESRELAEKLTDQVALLTDKNRALDEFRKEKSESLEVLQEQIKFLEIQSREYYKEFRDQKMLAEQLRDQLEKLGQRWVNGKARLINVARNLKFKLNASLHSESNLSAQLSSQAQDVAELSKKLSEATNYIAKVNKKAQDDVADCTEGFEKRIQENLVKISELEAEKDSLTIDVANKQKVLEENIRLTNKVVFYQRKYDDFVENSKQEIGSLQTRLITLTGQLETSELQGKEQLDKLEYLAAEKSKATDELNIQSEQLEALRSLWQDQQRSLEKLEEQNQALVKLNRDLSVQINSLRRLSERNQVEL